MYIKTFLPYTLSSCHESAKIAVKDFLSCLEAIDSIMVLNRPAILTIDRLYCDTRACISWIIYEICRDVDVIDEIKWFSIRPK